VSVSLTTPNRCRPFSSLYAGHSGLYISSCALLAQSNPSGPLSRYHSFPAGIAPPRSVDSSQAEPSPRRQSQQAPPVRSLAQGTAQDPPQANLQSLAHHPTSNQVAPHASK